MVGADPHHAQLRHGTGRYVFCEVLLPDIDAELVGDAQVELRIVLDRVFDEVRKRGVGADRVEVLELGLGAGLIGLRVGVELAPGWVAATAESRNKWKQILDTGTGAIRHSECVVFDVFAVVLEADTGFDSQHPTGALSSDKRSHRRRWKDSRGPSPAIGCRRNRAPWPERSSYDRRPTGGWGRRSCRGAGSAPQARARWV